MKRTTSTLSTNWRDVVCPPGPRRVVGNASPISSDVVRAALEARIAEGDFDTEVGIQKATILFRSIELMRFGVIVPLDSAACDQNEPPEQPTDELLELLSRCSLDKFQAVTASAMMEFLAVYEIFEKSGMWSITDTPVHVCYASIDKGTVSVPTELFEDSNRQFIVTHNHPNCSALSPQDFAAFAAYPSIRLLYACTIPYNYYFLRSDKKTWITKKDPNGTGVIDEQTVAEITNSIRASTDADMDSYMNQPGYEDLREAFAQGRGQQYLDCTEKGAKLWADVTHKAWKSKNWSDEHIFLYSRNTNNAKAEGLFGTTGNSGVLILLRKYREKRGGTGGLGDVTTEHKTTESESPMPINTDKRHTPPHNDEQGHFSPAYDVSKAFPELYSMSFAQALQAYGDGSDADAEALQIVKLLRNNPNAKVKIYRAVEKGLRQNISDLRRDSRYIRQNKSTPPWADVPPHSRDEYTTYVESQLSNLRSVENADIKPTIGVRDWVTITRRYAEDHGELAIPNGYTIITKTVLAKDLFTDGNSIHEWGYDPKIDTTLGDIPTATSNVSTPDADQQNPDNALPMTTADIVAMDPPESLPLTGELREFLSSLLAKFNMLIWGSAGSGKSSFVLRLANELAETNTGRVLYFMTEEKVASGRLKARMDLMKAYSDNINFDDVGTFDRLTALVNTGMYRYVIVDSINMINVEQTRIVELMQTFPEVSWIFIAQATKGKNAYAGIQSLAHAVDTEIATSNDKGVGVAELKKHRDGPLKTHTIFGNKGMRDPSFKKTW